MHFQFNFEFVNMSNVFTVSKFFYFFAKAFGAFPMTYEGPTRNGNLKTKWHDVLYSILCFCVVFFMLFKKFTSENSVTSDSTIVAITWNYSIILELSMLVIQLCHQIHRRHEIKSFLKLLNEIDLEMKQLGLQVDYKLHRKVVNFSTFLLVVINVVIGVFLPIFYFYTNFVLRYKLNIVVSIAYGYKNIFKFFYVIQLFLASFAVQDRLKLLNGFLRLILVVIFSKLF